MWSPMERASRNSADTPIQPAQFAGESQTLRSASSTFLAPPAIGFSRGLEMSPISTKTTSRRMHLVAMRPLRSAPTNQPTGFLGHFMNPGMNCYLFVSLFSQFDNCRTFVLTESHRITHEFTNCNCLIETSYWTFHI